MSLELNTIEIRKIIEKDNKDIATVIRNTLKEFGANHKGTVYFDSSTDHLYEIFNEEKRSIYYVALHNNKIIGGGGIFPSSGLPPDTCELVKMYLLPEFRGIGLGKRLIELCIDFATHEGYKYIYLETMPELKKALKIYEKFEFSYLNGPMGNTGHFGCKLWMIKKI